MFLIDNLKKNSLKLSRNKTLSKTILFYKKNIYIHSLFFPFSFPLPLLFSSFESVAGHCTKVTIGDHAESDDTTRLVVLIIWSTCHSTGVVIVATEGERMRWGVANTCISSTPFSTFVVGFSFSKLVLWIPSLDFEWELDNIQVSTYLGF